MTSQSSCALCHTPVLASHDKVWAAYVGGPIGYVHADCESGNWLTWQGKRLKKAADERSSQGNI